MSTFAAVRLSCEHGNREAVIATVRALTPHDRQSVILLLLVLRGPCHPFWKWLAAIAFERDQLWLLRFVARKTMEGRAIERGDFQL